MACQNDEESMCGSVQRKTMAVQSNIPTKDNKACVSEEKNEKAIIKEMDVTKMIENVKFSITLSTSQIHCWWAMATILLNNPYVNSNNESPAMKEKECWWSGEVSIIPIPIKCYMIFIVPERMLVE